MSALRDASLLLQDFRARSRTGFTIRGKTRAGRRGAERPRHRAGRINGTLFAKKIICSQGAGVTVPPRAIRRQESLDRRGGYTSNNPRPVIVSPMIGGRIWKIGDRVFDLSRQGLIMGILNVTPDSFSDGGRFFKAEKAVEHALRMAAAG